MPEMFAINDKRLARPDTLAHLRAAQDALSAGFAAVDAELRASREDFDRLKEHCQRLAAECAGLRGLADALRAERDSIAGARDDWKARALDMEAALEKRCAHDTEGP